MRGLSYLSLAKRSQKQSDDDFSRVTSQIGNLNEKSPLGKNANSSARNRRVNVKTRAIYTRDVLLATESTRNGSEGNEWMEHERRRGATRIGIRFARMFVTYRSKFSFQKMIQWWPRDFQHREFLLFEVVPVLNWPAWIINEACIVRFVFPIFERLMVQGLEFRWSLFLMFCRASVSGFFDFSD